MGDRFLNGCQLPPRPLLVPLQVQGRDRQRVAQVAADLGLTTFIPKSYIEQVGGGVAVAVREVRGSGLSLPVPPSQQQRKWGCHPCPAPLCPPPPLPGATGEAGQRVPDRHRCAAVREAVGKLCGSCGEAGRCVPCWTVTGHL